MTRHGTKALSADEHAALAAAIARAEAGTIGEIRVLVTTQPLVRHPFHALMWAALAALVLPWPLALLTPLGAPALLSLQAILFVVAGAVLVFTPLGARCVPGAALHAAARAAAIDHFQAFGMHATQARTGVLIMVALPEHLVEVVADQGIHAHVGLEAWQAVCAAVLEGARRGQLAEGLTAGVAEAGRLLTLHLPRTDTASNELPDRVVVL